MNVLIVLAHPERESFNGGMVDAAVRELQTLGYRVDLDDLYSEGFDPVERASRYINHEHGSRFEPLTEQKAHFLDAKLPGDVQRELARLDWADLVIFQFPLWWHATPAILKGWFDRVLVYGGRYSGRMRYDRGFYLGKRALCSVTAGSPEHTFRPFGRAGNMVEWLWAIHSSLHYVGFDVLAPEVVYGVQGGGISYQQEDAFRAHLEDGKNRWAERMPYLLEEQPIPFTGWDDWDEQGILNRRHPWRWRV